ncbi:hypothetical protein ACNVED_10280 [Legionella sp. D16C41]|uniref:hypothetical protein n=1 Tax=Legionella sp. D16C41 TaxID=3402688 RepID=UPI003AF591FD
MNKITLISQKTMRQIHAAILESSSLHNAAGRLGVADATLQSHLGKVTYLDAQGIAQPLTYEAMKTVWPSEEVGKAAWGEAYEGPMNAIKIDLTQKTMRQIHAAILQSNSLQEAAGRLGVAQSTLQRHLGKVTYLDAQGIAQPLTYEAMKTVWPSEEVGKAAWGEAYEGPMNAIKIDLTQKTMRQIHAVILESSSLNKAAGQLGVRNATLQRHLGKVTYLDAQGIAQPLTYEAMKTVWPSEEVGKAAWGEAYEGPMNAIKIDLTQKTMRQIHEAILQNSSLQGAAGRLGVSERTLRSHLGKVTYLDAQGIAQPLTYEAMKTVWPSEEVGKAAWGEAYEEPMNATERIDLTQKTMRQIHAVILQSNSLQEAAGRLGIIDATLQRHLGKVTYLDAQGIAQSLTYEVMKTVWPSEGLGKAAWGEVYEEPMNAIKIDLTQKTMRQIHAVILQSNSLQEAAGRLGVIDATLQRHLGKVTYLDAQGIAQPLTYEAMKTVWPSEEVGKAAWGEAYEGPMNAIKIDLTQKTMRQIHAAILESSSLHNAVGRLGVADATLQSHLGKFTYLDAQGIAQSLTYEAMKTVWPSEEVGKAAWGKAYEEPMNTTKRIDLTQKTMRQIHAAILESSSLNKAAGQLGVRNATLQSHLGKVTYLDAQGIAQPLTYEAMKTVWPSEEVGKAAWGEAYEGPMNATKRIDLTQKTMRQIHAAILQSNSLQEAAGRLGVTDATLRSHLGKVTYLDAQGIAQPLTYEAMKTVWPSEEVGKAAWGEAYEGPMKATKRIDLSQKTMRQIHAVILQNSSLQGAAGRLGVAHATLRSHLGKFTYLDAQGIAQPLTYEVMKTVWPSEEVGKAAWGEVYEEPMKATKRIGLTQKTMRQIHAAILQSNSLQEAAGRLGVRDTTLQRHLGKVTYLDAQER